MKLSSSLPLTTLLALAACGGTKQPAPVPPNPYLGTLNIVGTMPAGTTSCAGTNTVTFTLGAVSPKTVTLTAGDCLIFLAGDTSTHKPATIGTPDCNELNSNVVIASGTASPSFETTPLDGPRTCHWMDSLDPPPTGGGGGGY